MPLKIKLPIDQKKTFQCPNCPFQTKVKSQFEQHCSDCDGSQGSSHSSDTVHSDSEPDDGKDQAELADDDSSSVHDGSFTDDLGDHKVFNRHYTCKKCGYATMNAKDFLFHGRDKHLEKFDIFPCDICDYASKWKCKVIRHREMIHKGAPPVQDYPKIKSSHCSAGKPSSRNDTKSTKTPLSMVPTPEPVPGLGSRLSNKLKLPKQVKSAKGKGKRIGTKRKQSQENDIPVKKRLTDGKLMPRGNFVQFMELCSPEGAEPRYKCKLCFYSNLRKWQIRQHVKARHVNAKLFHCRIGKCTFSTYRKAEFFAHKTKHNQITYECQECEYVTYLKPNLDRHKLNHGMKNAPYKCSLCSYASAKEAAVMRHVQEHHSGGEKRVLLIEDEPPGGKSEPKKLTGPPTMVNYGDRKVISDTCQERQATMDDFFKQADDFIDGQNNNNNESICHKESMCRGSLDSCTMPGDDGALDENVKNDLDDVIGDTAFICPTCGFAANCVEKLEQHMKSHEDDFDEQEVDVKLGNTGDKKKRDRKIVDPREKRDISDANSVESSKEFSCSHCKYKTGSKKNFENHIQFLCPAAEQNALISSNGDVVCNICGYVAVTMTRLKGHMVSHSNEYNYNCDLCPRKYKRSSDLNFHMKKTHNIRLKDYLQGSKEQEEPLNLSMRSNASNDSDKADSVTMEPADPGSVSEEPYAERPLDLSCHDENDDSQGSHNQCPRCPYTTTGTSEMLQHMLSHTEDEKLKCSICSARFAWRRELNSHLKNAHAGPATATASPSLPIGKAAESSPNLGHGALKVKKGVAGEYKCRYCDYVARFTSELMRHSRVHRQEKPYKCPYCHYCTCWKGDLKRHIEKHHSDMLPDEKAIYTILTDIEREVTDAFAREYAPFDGFESAPPVASSTPQKNEKSLNKEGGPDAGSIGSGNTPGRRKSDLPCRCRICGWKAPMHSKLHMHLVAHENLKIYKCTLCGFRTNWVWDTRKHVRAKHDISDPGPYCLKLSESEARSTIASYLEGREKQGASSCTLANQFVVKSKPAPNKVVAPSKQEKPARGTGGPAHHGYVRPFKCSVCPRRSNWRWELKKHIKIMHNGDGYCIVLSHEVTSVLG